MKTLIQIQHQLQTGSFEFTRHAFKRAVERNISDLEIIESGANVTIIEAIQTISIRLVACSWD